uniref:ARAD1D01562p n=1 Tax=Blastobotrys adeninivorans TaxID=409370 RepID=A0A060T880_BLAAD
MSTKLVPKPEGPEGPAYNGPEMEAVADTPVAKPEGTSDGSPAGGLSMDLEAGRKRRVSVGHRYVGLPDGLRNHVIAVIGEFVGTFMFLLFAYLVVQINSNDAPGPTEITADPAKLLMISFGFGFSVMVNVFVFFRVSGGQLNPAVTLTLALVRAITPVRALLLMPTQVIAGICAAAVCDALTPGGVAFDNQLGGGESRSRGVWIEAFGTALLCMTVLFMAVEKHRATFMAPLAIGIALFMGHMVAVYYTGAGLNPARSFGPNVVKASFPTYHWIYWVGPFIGSILSVVLHYLLKFLHYETANPGQDAEY